MEKSNGNLDVIKSLVGSKNSILILLLYILMNPITLVMNTDLIQANIMKLYLFYNLKDSILFSEK